MGPDAGTLLFTGFPGFIGARLLPRILEQRPATRVVCLTQERFLPAARASLAEIEASHPHARGRIELAPGDITQAGLGLEPSVAQRLHERLVGAYHLAAVYDLAVAWEVGRRINVEGTRNVLSFLAAAKRLERLDYVSTAYVSGRAVGVFRECDLDVGQGFRNHYEETKFLAELEVVRSGIPAAVYRPAIVVGDSRSGETAKFDGPYFVLAALERLPSPGLFVRVGSGANTINMVPVDFVVDALAGLSARPQSRGKTYHLTDPEPLAVIDVSRLMARALGKRFAYVPVPLALVRLCLAPAPLQRALGIPRQTLDYFDHPCRYDTSEAQQALSALGIRCPRLPEYIDRLVAFYRARRGELRRDAMI